MTQRSVPGMHLWSGMVVGNEKKKWEEMGKQEAKRAELCSSQRRDVFKSRVFAGCEMTTQKVLKRKKNRLQESTTLYVFSSCE